MERLKHVIEINVLLGAWLVAAPFVFGYAASHIEMGSDVVVGIVLIACSWWILTATAGQVAAGVLQLICGLWLIVGPFLMHYGRSSRPFNDDIIVGIATVLVSATVLRMLGARVKSAA